MVDKHLCDMALSELLAEGGHDCPCGKHHSCGLDFLKIGKGAISSLGEALEKLHAVKPFVVMDINTRAAAGNAVTAMLEKLSIPFAAFTFPDLGKGKMEPDEYAVGSLAEAYDPSCDVIMAVGSGVVNDCCKVLAHVAHVPSMVICTAPSMDGYASNSSSMIQNRVKVSLYNACPRAIIADTDILRTAPDIMLQAGLGDMLAKYVSICEWRISTLTYGDSYCEEIAELVRHSVKKIVDNSSKLMDRDDEALAAVAEGLVLSGVAMAFAEVSRPASGLEHYFSHVWEMQALQKGIPSELHGIQVGIGTLLTLWLYENVLNFDSVDAEKAMAFRADFSEEKWAEQTRRIFGSVAPEIFAIEAKAHKNSAEAHAERVKILSENWTEIRRIIKEELPEYQQIHDLMESLGMPLLPEDLGITDDETIDALVGSRDVRDKYLTSSMLWDLGLMDEAAAKLRQHLENERLNRHEKV